MNRRTLLKASTTLGALLAAGAYGRYRLLPPRRSRALEPADELARRFFAGLDAEQRQHVCVPYEHPLRQYHNRGVWGGGLSIFAGGFSWRQRGLLTDLLHAGLSAQGRERVPNEFFVNLPGVHTMKVLVCGDPHEPPYQLILSGPHLNLRIGGKSREGVAFGGPACGGPCAWTAYPLARWFVRSMVSHRLLRGRSRGSHRAQRRPRPRSRSLSSQRSVPRPMERTTPGSPLRASGHALGDRPAVAPRPIGRTIPWSRFLPSSAPSPAA